MWTVVYMSQDENSANTVADIFEKNNILYKIRTVGGDGENNSCYEVLVPETEINEAHSIIIENNLL